MPKNEKRQVRVTYYVLQTFSQDRKGVTVDEAVEKGSVGEALRASERAKGHKAGAVVFSRTGDPSTGDWDEAEILEQWGEVPRGLDEMAAA